VAETIDGVIGNLFLVTTPDFLDLSVVLSTLSSLTGVVDVEPDLLAHVADSQYTVPSALSDRTSMTYFGATVPSGYVNQPATTIIGLSNTLSTFHVTGAGTVAVIDTGVDPHHPALEAVLLPGYDFTRNQNGADETRDVDLTDPSSGSQAQWVSPNTAANLSQSTAAVVDGNAQYGDFGHGTMVAGIIHLVAPTAKILPLKAFRSDGTGYTSDILRAIYRAIASHANVINMSFNLASYSQEVATALNLATMDGTIAVAAAGNSGEETLVYPAALWDVMGIASSTNDDQLSAFSNYGPQLVWLAAPGEGIVTTYPFSTYAAGWGTSFSAPFVSGVAALMLSVNELCDQYASAHSAAHAEPMNANAGNGRLDTFQALQAWSQAVGNE
jgi:subtilisin family serine protease